MRSLARGLFFDGLVFLCSLLVSPTHAHRPNSFDCRNQPEWPIDDIDRTSEAQHFIHEHQNSCDKRIDAMHPGECGIGCNINWGVAYMVQAFFRNEVYRPRGRWTWAHPNISECTAELGAIDCFSKPLSLCGVSSQVQRSVAIAAHTNASSALLHGLSFSSPCDFAKRLNKSVQWVHGQFMHYFLRHRQDVAEYIQRVEAKIKTSIHSPSSFQMVYGSASSTIGCHVRGGVLDDGRSPANISVYIANIDTMAAELAKGGAPVSLVYFCSDLPEETLVSTKFLHETYPRPWKYMVLPHLSLGSGDAEVHMRNKSNPLRLETYRFVSEYYADIHFLVKADAFIGSESNLYPIVAALRVIKVPFRHNQTCYLDIRLPSAPLVCEGSPEAKQLWQRYFLGYNGGTSFSR